MQAIWSLKFEKLQNIGGQFALASRTPNSEGTSPSNPVIYANGEGQPLMTGKNLMNAILSNQ